MPENVGFVAGIGVVALVIGIAGNGDRRRWLAAGSLLVGGMAAAYAAADRQRLGKHR